MGHRDSLSYLILSCLFLFNETPKPPFFIENAHEPYAYQNGICFYVLVNIQCSVNSLYSINHVQCNLHPGLQRKALLKGSGHI